MGWLKDIFDDEEYEDEYDEEYDKECKEEYDEEYEEEIFFNMLTQYINSYFYIKFKKEVYFVPFFAYVNKLDDNNIIFNSLN